MTKFDLTFIIWYFHEAKKYIIHASRLSEYLHSTNISIKDAQSYQSQIDCWMFTARHYRLKGLRDMKRFGFKTLSEVHQASRVTE
jgi:hypothetical protein